MDDLCEHSAAESGAGGKGNSCQGFVNGAERGGAVALTTSLPASTVQTPGAGGRRNRKTLPGGFWKRVQRRGASARYNP